MKVCAYVRVSTDRQAEKGLGLEVQRTEIRKWAKREGHRVTTWTADEGVSGSNGLDTREGLLDALDAAKSGAVQGLVVYRLDRLARDLVLQEQLLAELRRLDTTVFSVSAAEASFLQDDPDDPSRKLIRQILGAVAEYERSMIALRLRSGRRRKADKGGYAYGSPPFGYIARNGALEPDEHEQRALDLMRTLAAQGVSLREIASKLEEAGFRPKRSSRWHPESVRRCLAQVRADQP